MAGMSAEDLGKRITAARSYAGIDIPSLADAISVTPAALQRWEAGLEELAEGDMWTLIKAIADATRLPEQFFTVDFQSLVGEEPPEARLARLERKVDEALARMDLVAAEADRQMTRGKKQLDRFIANMEPERELLRRIAAHLDVHH
jgi:transcriptional regulator with XRE-family HTH domain